MTSGSIPTCAPAATVLLLRDQPEGLEVLLMQRASQLAFHGGAWVFPGGRVDPSDADADPLRAAARAAVRETSEEAGLTLAQEALVPFSHWTTPAGLPRRFATWFFVAQVEPEREVQVDGGEIHAHRWLRPEAALTLQASATLDLPPPTFVTLSALRRFSRVAEVFDAARRTPPPVFVPRPRPAPGGIVSLYQEDVAYEGGELDQSGPRHRLCMFGGGWRYEVAF